MQTKRNSTVIDMDVNYNMSSEHGQPNPYHKSFFRKSMEKALLTLKDQMMPLFIATAAFTGIGIGLALRPQRDFMSTRTLFYIQFPGMILLNMLKMLMVPLVITSLVTSIAQLEQNQRSKIAGPATLFYVFTTAISVASGIAWVLFLEPGFYHRKTSDNDMEYSAINAFLSFILQCFPDNIVEAFFEKEMVLTPKYEYLFNRGNNSKHNISAMMLGHVAKNESMTIKKLMKQMRGMRQETNIIGLICLSVIVGIMLGRMGLAGYPLKKFFHSSNELVLAILHTMVWYVPIGLVFLVAGKIITAKDIYKLFASAGLFVITVIVGFLIHGCITLPLIYTICTRKNPFVFAHNQFKSILLAWGTSSSSAALPLTMYCLITKNNLNPDIVRFMVPIGAVINMDGTALYEAVASIFIAQMSGYDLKLLDVIAISISSAIVSIGAAGIPEAGLITVMVVLTSVGLPTNDITIVLAFDWLLDRFRTAVNVWGDAVGAGIIDHKLRHVFEEEDEQLDIVIESKISKTNPFTLDIDTSLTIGKEHPTMEKALCELVSSSVDPEVLLHKHISFDNNEDLPSSHSNQ